MFRTVIVLILMGLCGFYLYQKQQKEIPLPPEKAVTRDASSLKELRKKLPGVIFDKEIAPFLEKNDREGLTSSQVETVAKKLQDIGSALGKSSKDAIGKALRSFAPEIPEEKTLVERTAQIGEDIFSGIGKSIKDHAPDLKKTGEYLLEGLINIFSRLLNLIADSIKK